MLSAAPTRWPLAGRRRASHWPLGRCRRGGTHPSSMTRPRWAQPPRTSPNRHATAHNHAQRWSVNCRLHIAQLAHRRVLRCSGACQRRV